jgi:hypothetical protein
MLIPEQTMSYFLMAVFWVVAPCSLVEEVIIALMMEAASTSETLVNFYQTTRHNNPEDSHIYTRRHDKIKTQQCHMFSDFYTTYFF